jgi:GATA-binding protein, other eukaryote
VTTRLLTSRNRLKRDAETQAPVSSSISAPSGPVKAPSGIAQLRKSSEQSLQQPEPMNLDDFLHAENMATPTGLALTPTPENSRPSRDEGPTSVSNAITIKPRKDGAQHFMPSSVPVPQHVPRAADEFGYVPRRVRKTSIDERRVSSPAF